MHKTKLWLSAISFALFFQFTLALADETPTELTLDPSQVMGYETCQKCHGMEIGVWKQTPHFETYRSLHRKPEAKEIASKMGIRSIKRGELCLKCHYTQQESGGRTKAISGISCESCHGAAKNWWAIHNDYGGPTATKSSETPEHKKERVAKSIENGMRNPENVYLVARSCFKCHTVPEEKLVNVGGHAAGSESFEFVAWSQGMIRHNFLRTDYASNAVSAPDRLRVMYIAGLMAELEFSIRATAKATVRGDYGMASAKRAFAVRAKLAEIQDKLENPLLTRALDAAYGIKLKTNNTDELNLAADQISSAGVEFAETVKGSTLSAVDAYLPDPSQYKN
jgi:hypothetical protein